MKKIKIVHINTFLKGGAFQAARRLQDGLLQLNIESNLLGLAGNVTDGHFHEWGVWSNLLFKAATKLKLPINRAGKNARLIPSGQYEYEVYSFPTSDYDLTQHPLVRDADIIHLHWVNNFLDYPTFFKRINKPIVWTLHDMNLFQGGFHYLEDQQRNAKAFEVLDEELMEIKRKALSYIPNLQIVCPSQWLKRTSKSATLTSGFTHHHIYNGLDLNRFRPSDYSSLRQKYGLPDNKLLFLFVTERLDNHRKGFGLLFPVIQSLEYRTDIAFVAIGQLDKSLQQSNIIELGYIRDEDKLAEIYSASDAVILPSREDNLPNVILEATACGTPLIGFPIGGVPEVVKTGYTGILAAEVSSEALKSAVLAFADKNIVLDRDQIRAFAEQNFDLEKQAAKYLEIYEKLLGFSH